MQFDAYEITQGMLESYVEVMFRSYVKASFCAHSTNNADNENQESKINKT